MKTKEGIEKEFRKDLQELLDIYGAEMEVVDGPTEMDSATLNITIEPKYHEQTGKVIEEYVDFNI